MAVETPTKPVGDGALSKVNNEIEVGADLEFQKRWWKFENRVWVVFTSLIALDLIGAFGHGFVAQARMTSADGNVEVKYERIERYNTPSIMTVDVKPGGIHEGKVLIWVADSLLTDFGNQIIVPQPRSGALYSKGILYTFPAGPVGDSVKFTLQPKKPGLYQIDLRVAGTEMLAGRVAVMP